MYLIIEIFEVNLIYIMFDALALVLTASSPRLTHIFKKREVLFLARQMSNITKMSTAKK